MQDCEHGDIQSEADDNSHADQGCLLVISIVNWADLHPLLMHVEGRAEERVSSSSFSLYLPPIEC